MLKKRRDDIIFWGFLTPVLFAFLIIVIIPFFIGIYYSFTNWSAIPGKPIEFLGFQNYLNILSDKAFGKSFIVTVIYSSIAVVMINIVGFLLALLVTQGFKSSNLLRTTFFMPNLIGGLILGFLWKFIFLKISPSLASTLELQLLEFNWLADANLAILAMAIVTTWQMSGYIMIIYIAAIQSIPESLVEASKIDGAHAIQRVIHIIFPLVAQAFTISLFLTLSNSFKMFDVNLALTNGGPAGRTELLTLNIYSTAFAKLQFGYGQAKAIIFFIIVTIFTVTQVRITKKREIEA